MAYNNNIPLATDRINTSQPQLLANFQAIPVLLAVNHFSFGDPDEGKHKFITFAQLPTGSTAVPGAPAGNDINMYSAVAGGNPELHLRRSAGSAIPFTQQFSGSNNGWTYLPSGMLMVWGRGTIASTQSTVTIDLSTVAGFPGFSTSAITVQLTRVNNATSQNFIQLDTISIAPLPIAPGTQTFVARRSTSNTGSSDQFAWFAVGLGV